MRSRTSGASSASDRTKSASVITADLTVTGHIGRGPPFTAIPTEQAERAARSPMSPQVSRPSGQMS